MNRPTNAAVKIAGIAVALSCLGGALAGCSGSDSDGGSASDDATASASASDAASPSEAASDAPSDASKTATTAGFCAKLTSIGDVVGQGDPDDAGSAVKSLRGWVSDMEAYGTPSELSDKAFAGFEVLIGIFNTVDDDTTAQELQELGSDIPAADDKKLKAFTAWTTENCQPAGSPSASPSDGTS